MNDWKAKLHKLEPYRYPLLILLLGVMLMLLPGGIRSPTTDRDESDFSALLSRIDGVGESCLVLSEQGAVIVCEGAEDTEVRYALLQAVRSYTGFSSDRITILKMTEH